MKTVAKKTPRTKVNGRLKQALTRVPVSRIDGAPVNCGRGGMVNASALGADEYCSAIAFLVQKNVLKSERWVIAFKGDPTLFLFSGVTSPTPAPLSA